jgi:hypothetical protein
MALSQEEGPANFFKTRGATKHIKYVSVLTWLLFIGFCQLTEKMEKRTCALCPEGHDWSVIYFVPSANIAAHENCLVSYW